MMVATNSHLIVGAGATGWSVARYLDREQIPYRVVDSRLNPPNEQQFRSVLHASDIHFGSFDIDWFDQPAVLVLSPGIARDIAPLRGAAIASSNKVISDIELFAKVCDKPYVAITGSNGKSTVTAMVEFVLNENGKRAIAGGNYGIPALDLLVEGDFDCYVLELSSFQLESTYSLQATVAVLLNVTDDHLDRHGQYEIYRDIKKSIFKGAGACVLNRDQQDLLPISCDGDLVTIGLNEPIRDHFGIRTIAGKDWLVKGEQRLICADQLKVAGEHNIVNALATLAVADQLQLDLVNAAKSLSRFKGLPYRCQLVAEVDQVRWFNDSKGTNIGATQAAISGLPRGQVLICGGVFKGGELALFKQTILNKVNHVIVFGKDQKVFMDLLQNDIATHSVVDLPAAITLAKRLAEPEQCVLFSPACASFDMFDNYIHRGNEFNRHVEEIVRGVIET